MDKESDVKSFGSAPDHYSAHLKRHDNLSNPDEDARVEFAMAEYFALLNQDHTPAQALEILKQRESNKPQ